MAFEYTSKGVLSSRVLVLACATSLAAAFYNGVEFLWRPSPALGSSVVLAVPTFNALPVTGFSANLVPQPPPGTDGVVFGFHHDDYDSSVWMPSLLHIRSPGHTRVAVWRG